MEVEMPPGDTSAHAMTALQSADFDHVYREELPAIIAVVYAVCGDRWAAEDLAHDAFMAAYRGWDRVGHYDKPGAFVRRVALNLARSRLRRVGAEARALARHAAGQTVHVEALHGTDHEFWNAVRSLPRRQREAVALRYVDDLDEASIAEILGCAPATVRVHLHRARLALAKALDSAIEVQ